MTAIKEFLTGIPYAEWWQLCITHAVLIVVVAFFAGMILYGHYRGFIRMAVSVGAVIISLLLVRQVLPFVTGKLRGSALFEAWSDRIAKSLLAGNADTDYSALYRILGLDDMAEATGDYLAGLLINVLCFLLLFVLVNLLLKLAAHFMERLTELPILHGTNQLLGAALGFAEAVLYLWVFLLGIALTPGAAFSQTVTAQVLASPFLTWFYHNNFLLNILAGILG